jgi:Skp family chaperone for outer membrane proteins
MRAAWKRYAQRHSVPERRAEKYFRNRGRRQEEENRFHFAALGIVNADQIANDRTRFQHRGARYESEIERIANEILSGRKTMSQARKSCDQVTANYDRARKQEACRKKKSNSRNPSKSPR